MIIMVFNYKMSMNGIAAAVPLCTAIEKGSTHTAFIKPKYQ